MTIEQIKTLINGLKLNIPHLEWSPELGISSAAVGQTVRVAAVDDNGMPTAWEAVDMTGGSGGGLPVLNLADMDILDYTEVELDAERTQIVANAITNKLPIVVSYLADGDIVSDMFCLKGHIYQRTHNYGYYVTISYVDGIATVYVTE